MKWNTVAVVTGAYAGGRWYGCMWYANMHNRVQNGKASQYTTRVP